jgi:aminoglycoside phosphotransferase (APT) family kinase protein
MPEDVPMRAISLPPTPYDATADRPGWRDLPAGLRAAIERRLGAPVVADAPTGAGFTRGFASVLTTAAGDRAFVKAADLRTQPHVADWYAREAALTAALPAPVPAARPRWTAATEGHYVLCLEAIDGHVPPLPWRPDELVAALDAWATAAEALREPPAGMLASGLPRLSDLLRADLSCWGPVAAGREPLPPAAAALGDLGAARLSDLAALEAALPGYADSTSVIHCDLRLDNVLIDRAGAAWLCDWNWPCLGAPWFDTAALLVTAYASGLDADRLFAEHPTARDAPADALDATLAALSGHWLTRASARTDASPHLGGHNAWSGRQALAWLAERRSW